MHLPVEPGRDGDFAGALARVLRNGVRRVGHEIEHDLLEPRADRRRRRAAPAHSRSTWMSLSFKSYDVSDSVRRITSFKSTGTRCGAFAREGEEIAHDSAGTLRCS